MTALDLINGSLRLLGVLATGEAPAADEANDALNALNEMLDSWSTESLLIYAKIIESFALVGGQQVYTMGSGGNFNTARPLSVERAAISVLSSNPANEIPLELLNLDQWANINVKTVTSSIPLKLYIDGANPLTNLNLWPIPTVANNIVLYSWKPLSSIATLQTAIVIPPGYLKALRFNLAMTLAAEFGRQVDPIVAAGAAESKASIKRMNVKDQLLVTDPAIAAHSKSFNWITGE